MAAETIVDVSLEDAATNEDNVDAGFRSTWLYTVCWVGLELAMWGSLFFRNFDEQKPQLAIAHHLSVLIIPQLSWPFTIYGSIGNNHRVYFHLFNVLQILAVIGLTGNLVSMSLDGTSIWLSVLRLLLLVLALLHSLVYLLVWDRDHAYRLVFIELPRCAQGSFNGIPTPIRDAGSDEPATLPDRDPAMGFTELWAQRAHATWFAMGFWMLFAGACFAQRVHPTFDEPRQEGPVPRCTPLTA